MLQVFKCPHCRKLLETNQEAGDEIACPYCEEEFTLREGHAVQKSATRETLFRLAIPLGYVLFVAVPLGLTVWFFVSRAERQQKEAAEAAEVAAAAEVTATAEARKRGAEKPPAPPAPRPLRKPKIVAPGEPGTPESDPVPPEPKRPEPEVPESKTPEPKAPEPEVEVAPEPRELPEVAVAPAPREIVWKLPPMEPVTPWQRAGAVDLRVAGAAILRVPIVDAKEQVRESAQPMLVVVIEVRMNVATKKRDLLSWTHGQVRYMAGFLAGGKDLPHLDLPLGSKVHTGLPLKQPIPPPDEDPVRDILVFTAPPEGAGELSLRLDGERLGEPTDIWFKIPPTVWKK